MVVFFFFQAEDGIRDWSVTGVQTCALPISFSGGVHMNGLTIAHPMLAPVPVPHLGFDGAARGIVDVRQRRLTLKEATVDFRNLHAVLTADVENLGRHPKFTARLMVKPLSCQAAL